MQAEYDFSTATRGRHARRFSTGAAQAELRWYRDAVAYDEQAWLGEALRRTQELEGLLVAYLVLGFHLAPPAAARDVAALLNQPDGPTLTRIIEDLRAHAIDLPVPVLDRLRSLAHERHWLVHQSLQLQPEGLVVERSKRLVTRLQRLSLEATQLAEELGALIVDRFVRGGMTQAEFRRQTEAVIQDWLAA